MAAVMNRRVAFVPPALALLVGGCLLARAAAAAPAPDPQPVPAARPVITVHTDTVPAHPSAAAVPPAARQAQVPPPPPPAARLPGLPATIPKGGDYCESRPVAHPVGFTQMGGSGSDTISRPGGQTTTYQVYPRDAALQFVCLAPTSDGGVDIQAVLQPVGPDTSVYEFTMGPSGLVLVSIEPGRAAWGITPVPVGQRLADWPSTGCWRVALADAGTSHATIDDTFCFGADGSLRHVTLNERAAGSDGTTRKLSGSLDLNPGG